MKSIVDRLTSRREALVAIAWRAALFILPWQTRWMRPAVLADWPWEQGTLSVYASWFPMLATIALCWGLVRRRPSAQARRSSVAAMVALVLVSVLACVFSEPATRSMRLMAVAQWWVQVLLLAGFAMALWRAEVDGKGIAAWVMLSLVPHALIGWAQYAFQGSPAHQWLGLAYRSGKELGMSVVEHGEFRVLRAYGGFPHPNIFGGWLALGFCLAMRGAAYARDKGPALVYTAASALFASVLVLTYSRGAWVAAAVGLLLLAAEAVRHRKAPDSELQYLGLAVFCTVALAGAVTASQWDHVRVRFQARERLEVKSLETRKSGLIEGWDLLRSKPFFGAGPNAALLDIEAKLKKRHYIEPLEPPHMGYLAAAVDVGILGVSALAFLAWSMRRSVRWHLPLAVISVIALFDHYPWSTWSGMVLAVSSISLAIAPYTRRPEAGSTE